MDRNGDRELERGFGGRQLQRDRQRRWEQSGELLHLRDRQPCAHHNNHHTTADYDNHSSTHDHNQAADNNHQGANHHDEAADHHNHRGPNHHNDTC